MTKPLTIIDPTKPIPVLEVDDILDNHYWKFCVDDLDAETPTFNDFEYGPQFKAPAGSVFRMKHLWGIGETGTGEPRDYQIKLHNDMPVWKVVRAILSRYWSDMAAENSHGRFLFIEQIRSEAGEYMIEWGT